MEQNGLSAELPALLPRLWRFALRLAGDRHDAEDLVQRACVRALERRSQLQPGTSTLSWLFSIVHSVWLNEVRARQIRSRGSIQWSRRLPRQGHSLKLDSRAGIGLGMNVRGGTRPRLS